MDCFVVGDIIELKSNKSKAKIKFIGSVKGKQGIYYGIELLSAKRNANDGTFKGIKYFNTINDEKRGLFIKKDEISSLIKLAVNMFRITVNDSKYLDKYDCFGFIKFIGNVNGKSGVYYGIELLEPRGKNNGTLKDRQYFKCGDNYGIFVKSKEFQDELISDAQNEEKEEKFNAEEEIDPNMDIEAYLDKKKIVCNELVIVLKDEGVYFANQIKNIRYVWNSVVRKVCKMTNDAESKKNASKMLKKFERILKKQSRIKSTIKNKVKDKSKKPPRDKSRNLPNNIAHRENEPITEDTTNNNCDIATDSNTFKQRQIQMHADQQKDLSAIGLIANMFSGINAINAVFHDDKNQKLQLERETVQHETEQIPNDSIRKQLEALHGIEIKQIRMEHKLEIDQLQQSLSVTTKQLESKVTELANMTKYKLETNALKQQLLSVTQQLETKTVELTGTKQELSVATQQLQSKVTELQTTQQELLATHKRVETLQNLQANQDATECKKCTDTKTNMDKSERVMNHIILDKYLVWDNTTYLKWSIDAVVDFISTVDGGKYQKYEKQLRETFKAQGVNGEALPHIVKNDLQGWGITNFMDRTNMFKEIKNIYDNKPKIINNPPGAIAAQVEEDEGVIITAYK